jgi:predicted nucleic acid-binding protein
LSDPSFVIDASVAIAGLSPDEDAAVVLDRALASGCHVPAIWPFEVENILALRARRPLITAEDRPLAAGATQVGAALLLTP